MKVGLIFNKNNKTIFKDVLVVAKKLSLLNTKILMQKDFEKIYDSKNITYFYNENEIFKQSDILIAIGGDGTMIRTLKFASYHNKAVFGINSGHLGFLCSLEKSELSRLKEVVQGNYKISERNILKCSIKENVFFAFNDIFLSRDLNSESGICSYSFFDEDFHKICSYNSDGIIISTSTGSTAYSLSAGGPIVEPSLNCAILTAVCPHSLNCRSMIVDVNKAIYLKCEPKDNGKILFFIDGKKCCSNLEINKIKIENSNLKAKIIYLKDYNFYDKIEKKILNK